MSIQSEINRLKNNVAATYAAMEEQGATMPTQQNSANLAATARTIPTGSRGGTTVQADWAVNNPTKAAYVKNRTHWKEDFDGPEGEVISETEVSFTSNIKTVTGAMSDGIQVGGLYVVSWNGTDYECVGKSGSDGNYIGNGSFMNAGSITFEDTGEPFCVLLFGGTYYQLWKATTTTETVTVKVVGKKETVWHKLDKRYLDEALQFGNEMVEILPETTVEIETDSGEGYLTYKIGLAVGNAYAVKWNGTEYNCIAQDVVVPIDEDGNTLSIGVCVGDLGLMLGGESTGEPFVIIATNAIGEQEFGVPTLIQALDGSASVTLSITYNGIKKIDGKYLPDGVPYIESDLVLLLPTTTAEVIPDEGMAPFVDVADLVIGNAYTVNYNGVEYPCVAQPYEEDGMVLGCVLGNFDAMTGAGDTGEPFVLICVFSEMVEALGIGMICFPLDGAEIVTVAICSGSKTIHKIAGELLPNGMPYAETFDDVIMAETEVDFASGGMIPIITPITKLEIGKTYNVNWGSKTYHCVARKSTGTISAVVAELGFDAANRGNWETEICPFEISVLSEDAMAELGAYGFITARNSANLSYRDDKKVLVSIVGGFSSAPVDERCLPTNCKVLHIKASYNDKHQVWLCDTYGGAAELFHEAGGRIVLNIGAEEYVFMGRVGSERFRFVSLSEVEGVPTIKIFVLGSIAQDCSHVTFTLATT